MANKPRKATLEKWWAAAIAEGMACQATEDRQRNADFEFELLYWAGMMYVKPMTLNGEGPFKLAQTYDASKEKLLEYESGVLDWLRETASDKIDDVLDEIGFLDTVARSLLSLKLKDLALYWNEERAFRSKKTAKQVLCGSLRKKLEEHRGRKIILVAHSMGSIISYDTLMDNPDIEIDTFITIGSPLGLSRVKRQAARLQKTPHPLVPANIKTKWYNFADKRDPVAIDTSLCEDYLDSKGEKCIVDDLVYNQYTFVNGNGKIKANPHKSYGYLRCPEVARVLAKAISD